MTTRRWFQLSLLLPVVTPILLLPMLWTRVQVGVALLYLAVSALALGGIAYVPFAIGMSWAFGRVGPGRVMALAAAGPLLYAAIEALSVLALGPLVTSVSGAQFGSLAGVALMLGLCGFVFGVVYVTMAFVLYAVLRVIGVIRDPVEERRRPAPVRWGADDPRPARYSR